jgi:hypothetical protein
MGDSTDFRFITCMADPTSGLACGLPGPTLQASYLKHSAFIHADFAY